MQNPIMTACSLYLAGCVDTASQPEQHLRADAMATVALDTIPLKAAKLIIEQSAVPGDEDTGLQGFVDGEPWTELEITGPDGVVLRVLPKGGLAQSSTGLTELFFETNEPPNDEVPIATQLANMPAGTYHFEAETLDGVEQVGTATLSHSIPRGPVITTPEDAAIVSRANDLFVRWSPVTKNLSGALIEITHYEVIVTRVPGANEPVTRGFGRSIFDVKVPSTLTSLRVPREFLEASSHTTSKSWRSRRTGTRHSRRGLQDAVDVRCSIPPSRVELPTSRPASFRMTRPATSSVSARLLYGLSTNASAPSSRQERASPSLAKPETITIFAWGSSFRIRSKHSRPDITGIAMSSNTRSKCRASW